MAAALLYSFSCATFSAPCPSGVSVPDTVARTRLLILGETHGTAQIPRFVQCYVSDRAKDGYDVVLALELPKDEQAGLNSYLESQGDRGDRRELLRLPFWSRPSNRQDGRSSEAMFELVEAVRQFNQDYPKQRIRLEAIGEDEDGLMNEHVRQIVKRHDSKRSRVIVLVGDIHASLRKGNFFDPQFESLGYLLRELSPIALFAEFESGTAWVCSASEKCGALTVQARRSAADGMFGISLHTSRQDLGFDGTFFVGEISASNPAADGDRERP